MILGLVLQIYLLSEMRNCFAMLMLALNETIDQMAMANSVH